LSPNMWRKLAPVHETLCVKCFSSAAIEAKVDLDVSCLLPCSFNLLSRPHSWFDLFMAREKCEPANIAEWRAAMASCA
jgi:hypothetical protein